MTLSTAEVAKKAGIDRATLERWLAGGRSPGRNRCTSDEKCSVTGPMRTWSEFESTSDRTIAKGEAASRSHNDRS